MNCRINIFNCQNILFQWQYISNFFRPCVVWLSNSFVTLCNSFFFCWRVNEIVVIPLLYELLNWHRNCSKWNIKCCTIVFSCSKNSNQKYVYRLYFELRNVRPHFHMQQMTWKFANFNQKYVFLTYNLNYYKCNIFIVLNEVTFNY